MVYYSMFGEMNIELPPDDLIRQILANAALCYLLLIIIGHFLLILLQMLPVLIDGLPAEMSFEKLGRSVDAVHPEQDEGEIILSGLLAALASYKLKGMYI